MHTAIKLSELSSNGHGIIDGNRVIFSIGGTHTLNFSGMVDFEIDTGIASGDEYEVVIFVDDVVIKRVSGSDEKIETVKYKGVVTECIKISSSLGTTFTFLKMNEVNYKGGRVKAEDFKEFVYMKERLPYYEQNLQDVGLLKVPANAKYVRTSLSTLNSDGKISLTNASLSRSSVVCSGNETSLARAEFAVAGSIIAEIYSDTSNTDSYLEIDGKKVSTVGTSTEPLYFKGEVSDYMAIVSQINGERISFKCGIGVRELNGGILKSEDFGLLLDTAYNQGKHEKNLQNPHAITPEQIGALTKEQTEALVRSKVAELVDSAPEALDTLVELSKALGDDPNFATTIMELLSEKANNSEVNEALGKKADKVEVANTLKGNVIGEIVSMDDVSPIDHTVKVRCSVSGAKITRCGDNLLSYPYYHTTRTSSGVTFTDNGDGSITLNGTAEADNAASFYFVYHESLNFKDGVTYYIPDFSDKGISFILQYLDENGTTVYGRKAVTWNKAYTLRLIWLVVAKSGTSFTNEVIYPYLSIRKDAEYERYEGKIFEVDSGTSSVEIPPIYPTTTLFTDVDGAVIEAEYNKDLNKVFGNIDSALDSILVIQEGHAAASVTEQAEGGDEI